MDALGEYFAATFERVAGVLQSAGVATAGPPFARYRGHPGDHTDVETGFPVSAGTAPVPGLVMGALPAGRAVEVVHVGDYAHLPDTYALIDAWAADHGVAIRDEMWEVYESGPASDPDPATWRTRIVCPVAEPQLERGRST
jgi:effector-binding domain-containing protein